MVLRIQSAISALLIGGSTFAAHAQCLQNHYITDGATAAQVDCQPLAALQQLSPEQMSADAQALFNARHADLLHAARFYGFDLDAPGWTYRQLISPIVQKHLLLSFSHAPAATVISRASQFVAIIPASRDELVQVAPPFSHALHPLRIDWQNKSTFSVFNRLLATERDPGPVTRNSQWVNLAALYIALAGGIPSIPTETDSIVATWDLAVKRASTPVIIVSRDGSATIAFSEISDPARTLSWKLVFDRNGRVQKASRTDLRPERVKTMQTVTEGTAQPLPAPSSLNR